MRHFVFLLAIEMDIGERVALLEGLKAIYIFKLDGEGGWASWQERFFLEWLNGVVQELIEDLLSGASE